MEDSDVGPNYSFDEFKLYYDSTEKVTDRRLDTNRWNYSICIATLIAIAGLVKWSLGSTTLLWIGLFGVATLSMMAVLFCSLWVGQIRDFKKLNNAKFAVLNEMAPKIEFDTEKPGAIVSYCPFEKEWSKLSSLNALDEVGRANFIALKSSNVEYFIPKAFRALFAVILIVLIVFIFTNWPVNKPTQAEKAVSVPASSGSRP